MEFVNLSIPNMHCGGWVRTVSMTVRLLPGIEEVSADFKTRSASIRFDPSLIDLKTIQLALADIGYDASPQATL